ncbi:MAG: M90 family metallopeptidase [Pseudomonadota bacterium]
MTMLLVLFGAVLALALWAWGGPVWREHRRRQQRRTPFPQAWRKMLQQRVPYLRRLPADLRLQLQGHIQVFLAEKAFIGCRGLVITDEMKLVIAAQACLLLLNQPRPAYFPGMRQVLVYPAAFRVDRHHTDEAGVVTQEQQVLSGESWSQGQVILSWHDVVEDAAVPGDGYNVVVHEFAHQLDQEDGEANGAPPLRHKADYARWSKVMHGAFSALQAQVERGEDTLLGDYAATEPAEFFAVASEVFFELPDRLLEAHADLYRELARYYRIDPLSW